MTQYLHTMYRITDPAKSRTFYEALGLEFRRDMDIVRNGEKEATNYFFGVPGQEEELELTFNHDGRTYDLGTGYGHIALSVDDMEATLAALKKQGIEPEREPYQVDQRAVIDACAATGTWIELNASPYRFDMDWRLWPYARSKGVKCVINCDAHRIEHAFDVDMVEFRRELQRSRLREYRAVRHRYTDATAFG